MKGGQQHSVGPIHTQQQQMLKELMSNVRGVLCVCSENHQQHGHGVISLSTPALGEKVFCIEFLGLDNGFASSLCTKELIHLYLLVLVALVILEKAANLQLRVGGFTCMCVKREK